MPLPDFTPSHSPLNPEERLPALDVLRGLAIYAALFYNLIYISGAPEPATNLDQVLSWVQRWLVLDPFFLLFCMLFGLGFAFQLQRTQNAGASFVRIYHRRLLVLLLIGLIHGFLIWSGDILVSYALVGFFLLLFRRASSKVLLISILICLLVVPLLRDALLQQFHVSMLPRISEAVKSATYAHGSLSQIIAQRAHDYLDWLGRWPLYVYPGILATFLLGLYLGREGRLREWLSRPALLHLGLIGSLVLVALSLLLQASLRIFDVQIASWPHWIGFSHLYRFSWGLLAWGLAGLYAGTVVLILRTRRGAVWLSPFAAVGRCALSNYIAHSVIATLLFYNYGLGWYGQVGYTGMFWLSLVIFAGTTVLSVWWLAHFRFGPAEWLWRALTYGARL